MALLLYSFIFLLGLIVGSFLNVVISRLKTGEDMVKTRSHCPRCGSVLEWYDLIPLASFFILRGRCRRCGKKISWQYPAVELATGLLFLLVVWNLGFDIWDLFRISDFGFRIFNLLYLFFVVCSLIVIFVYDLRHYIIPDKVLWLAVLAAFLWDCFSSLQIGNWSLAASWQLIINNLWPYLASALAAAAFFLAIVLLTRGKGMGLGDVKLALLMGLILGWPQIILALFLAFFAGALVGVALVLGGKKTMQSQIPFGPFLAGATLLALFFGSTIFLWSSLFWRA